MHVGGVTMNDEIILSVNNLKKWFPLRRSIAEVFKGKRKWVKAVDGISFDIKKEKFLRSLVSRDVEKLRLAV